jgi:4-aminobutyrate aminotransferase
VVDHAQGAIVTDVDGNRFLDFNAGIAVVAAGHCHPRVVHAIQEQAARLIHMSGTDFYYENMVLLPEINRVASTSATQVPSRWRLH